MEKVHEITDLAFNDNFLLINIDGKKYKFNLENYSSKLLNALEQERNYFKISPSGYGISWPLLDEDLSIDGLLKVEHKVPSFLKQVAGY